MGETITLAKFKDSYPIHVYSDASLKNKNGNSFTSAGYVIESYVYNFKFEDYKIFEGTSSYGEMVAIHLAVLKLCELVRKNVFNYNDRIILFSDSEYCVKVLNEWIFRWFNRYNYKDDKLTTSSGNEVAHQSIIISIIENILYHNLNINIYHTYGHVEMKGLKRCQEKLIKNGLNVNINTAEHISKGNSYVDKESRNKLNKPNYDNVYNDFISFKMQLNNKDLNRYKKLIKKKM